MGNQDERIVTYEQRRSVYMEHIKTCTVCTSSFTGKPKLAADERGIYDERYKTISQFCKTGRQLVESCCGE